jgi:hypothetical protein
LEAVLLDHPGIYDAAVIGVKKGKSDDSEYPRAYIVRKNNPEGKKLDAKAIFEYMGTKLAKFKRPEGGVVFIDEVPKNPSGKVSLASSMSCRSALNFTDPQEDTTRVGEARDEDGSAVFETVKVEGRMLACFDMSNQLFTLAARSVQ